VAQAKQHNSQVRYVIIYADFDPIELSMAKDHLSRKLAVILHADVVGANIQRYPLKIEYGLMQKLNVIEEASSQGHAKTKLL
jgi:hypothetical protein